MQIASSNVSSNATQEAALEKQIKAKEDEAKSVKDQVQAAKLQQEIATLKAKLAALEAADKAAQQEQSAPSTAAAPPGRIRWRDDGLVERLLDVSLIAGLAARLGFRA